MVPNNIIINTVHHKKSKICKNKRSINLEENVSENKQKKKK